MFLSLNHKGFLKLIRFLNCNNNSFYTIMKTTFLKIMIKFNT